jgi:hypothetical protein
MGVAASSGSRAEDVLRYGCQAWQLAPDDWPVLRLLGVQVLDVAGSQGRCLNRTR